MTRLGFEILTYQNNRTMKKDAKQQNSTDTQMGYDTVLANRKTSDREALKHKYFVKTELYWVRRRDSYRFDNEECGLAIDHYLETGQEP